MGRCWWKEFYRRRLRGIDSVKLVSKSIDYCYERSLERGEGSTRGFVASFFSFSRQIFFFRWAGLPTVIRGGALRTDAPYPCPLQGSNARGSQRSGANDCDPMRRTEDRRALPLRSSGIQCARFSAFRGERL